jgi:hypothetical protein
VEQLPAKTISDCAAILNACYHVRYYHRGARTCIGREKRQQAILVLGLTLREIFNRTEDFEPRLAALVDGLRPTPDQQAF